MVINLWLLFIWYKIPLSSNGRTIRTYWRFIKKRIQVILFLPVRFHMHTYWSVFFSDYCFWINVQNCYERVNLSIRIGPQFAGARKRGSVSRLWNRDQFIELLEIISNINDRSSRRINHLKKKNTSVLWTSFGITYKKFIIYNKAIHS